MDFPYRIIRPLGSGGMGRVSLAEEMPNGRKVALKYLSRSLDSQARKLFREEAALLSRLSHPNLVRIFDYRDDAAPFFVMEFVDGPSLAEAVGAADEAKVLDYFVQTCRGLHYIHSRNLLHRDLKPSNILVTKDGRIKLLDFGIAHVGTPAYLPPEALGGAYDRRSELYALGMTWREVLKGRSLPSFLSELLARLTAKNPNERPGSALSLIKYLNGHVATPFALSPEEAEAVVLEKPPWVERPAEEREFWKEPEGPTLVILTGPTGVGRTRFLEEMRWKGLLKNQTFKTFPDLHEATEAQLIEIHLALRRLARDPASRLIVLEYNQDLVTPALQKLLDEASTWKPHRTIELPDLNDVQARRLIRAALLDQPLEQKEESKIVSGSGGRPALILEALRHRGEQIPGDFAQAARAKVARLSAGARRLLSLIVAHPEPPESFWMDKLGIPPADLAESRLTLASSGILAAPSAGDGRLRLLHPSLAAAFRAALPAGELKAAHGDWIGALAPEAPEDKPSALAAHILEHALDAGESATARAWSRRALDFLSPAGQWAWIANLCARLLPIAETPMDLAIVHAHMAAVHYHMGRYEDALREYEAWFASKPDDGTHVETVKYRLLTGRTYATWGKVAEAKRLLNECLAAGDSSKHAHHRPFHAQAHLSLAALEQDAESALRHLRDALPLAAKDFILLGEIERALGEREQSLGRAEAALGHFQKAAAHYRKTGNAQAEALARNSAATTLRSEGRLSEALAEIRSAVSLSEAGGERLQNARYRENRALILMDLGLYGEAVEEREQARDTLDQWGTDLDRSLVKDHDVALSAFLGRADSLTLERIKAAARNPLELLADPARLAESLASIRAIQSPEIRADLQARLGADFAGSGLDGIALSLKNAAFLELQNIRQRLPEELKMDFDKRPDLKKLNEDLAGLLPKASSGPSGGKGDIPAARFRQFCAINRQMATKNDMNEILDRVIDAAIEITGAERGFILLKDGKTAKSPVPGFDVRVARNLNRETLKLQEFELSLSLVKQAIDKAAYILTEDAVSDPRFAEKKSVMDYRLRSVLVLPLEEEGHVFGVIYLDHRYQPGCFSEEDLALVNALAAQASLAIQKARLIEELIRSRNKLAVEVKEQAEKIETMSEELTKKRGELRYGYEEIIGQSPAMLKVFQILDDVSETSIPVWIHGESGTGKELIARSLHVNSPRAKGPFVAENVSAIPETLLESELFGHKKGAFTHADRDRVGLFEQASGGTLFLDEVADMSLAMQAKLLRVLQEGEVRPVGSSKKVKIDVRLVTASNRDLERMAAEGKFRQDLFFRINGLTINLPSLRNRKEDIPLLARHFVKKAAKEFNLPPSELTDRALKALMSHNWPGNVRELEAILRNALLFAKGKPIGPDHLTIKASSAVLAAAEPSSQPATAEDEAHRKLIVTTLRKHHLNKEEAASELNVSLRTLYTWMEKHRIPKKKALLAQFVESA